MAGVVDETKQLCLHQESVDDATNEAHFNCMHCGRVIQRTKEMLHHAAEKGKHMAHSVADSFASFVTEEDILEAEEKLKELEQEEAKHLAKETAIYERKSRARTPDAVDHLHEEQMDEHEVRLEVFKRKEKAAERLNYLRKKREEQLEELSKSNKMAL